MVKQRSAGRNARVVWSVENPDMSENGLAVWRGISVGLEERNRGMEHESRSKSREFRGLAKRFQESKSGSLGGSEHTEPILLVGEEQGIPAVEHGVRDIKPGTKLSDSISSGKILGNDTEDKKQAISTIGDDQIRKNGMGMATASADNSADTDGMINRSSRDKVNEIPVIGGMGVAGVGGTTIRAGFLFREKTSHK